VVDSTGPAGLANHSRRVTIYKVTVSLLTFRSTHSGVDRSTQCADGLAMSALTEYVVRSIATDMNLSPLLQCTEC